MIKKLLLVVIAVFVTVTAFAQRVPENQVADVWRDGLTDSQIKTVERFIRGMDDTSRWTVYSAVVRSKEYAKERIPGEPLTQMKVLADVKVRLSVEDSQRFQAFWGKLDARDRSTFVTLLRDIQNG